MNPSAAKWGAAPSRRVVLLGASNLTMNIGRVHQMLRRLWPEPLDIMVAMGHGRSYGLDSHVLVRKLPSIVGCQLWNDLAQRPPLPTVALMTDIGNDILYEVEVDELSKWVNMCATRLHQLTRAIVITKLPVDSVRRFGPTRFRILASLYFPRLRITYAMAIERAVAMNKRLVEFASASGVRLMEVDDAWYGIDGIHHSWRWRSQAWQSFLTSLYATSQGDAAWNANPAQTSGISNDFPVPALQDKLVDQLRWWTFLASRRPSSRGWFGRDWRGEQPAVRLRDGTTWSFY